MVARLSRRDQFARLRAHSTTIREGRLRISYVDPDDTIGPSGAAVAFAVPRKYGTAVRRNRVRRRLRELMRDLADRGELPTRWFLVSVMSSPEEPGYHDLSRWLRRALMGVREHGSTVSGSHQLEGSTGGRLDP